jgi:hypothetical protein
LKQRLNGDVSQEFKGGFPKELQVARFKALDLPLGFVGRDAVCRFNPMPEAYAPARVLRP